MRRSNFLKISFITAIAAVIDTLKVYSGSKFFLNNSVSRYASDWPFKYAKCIPVPLKNVKLRGFLGKHIEANVNSISRGLECNIVKGFEARAKGELQKENKLAADSDLYKWIEGASYACVITGDKDLEKELDHICELVIKCQQPDGYINTLYSGRQLTVLTPNTIRTLNQLKAELNRIREFGYAHDNQEYAEGLQCLAAPIYDRTDQAVASISASFLSARANPDHFQCIADSVKRAAKDISEWMGGRIP